MFLVGQGFLHPWVLRVPVTPCVGAGIVASLMILGVSDLLEVELPLAVVGVGG